MMACVLVRLPHFLSPDFFFDGDEATVGIMAQDILTGKSFPFYFYGQNYGFSLIEAISTAFFIGLFGSGIWALKLGALLIFSVGLSFVWLALKDLNVSKSLSIGIMTLLITAPTWFLWGAMPRGGYVTSFMCVCVLFYITQSKELKPKWVILAALFIGVAYVSQVLILLPILAFIVVWLLSGEKVLKNIVVTIAVAGLVIIGIQYIGKTQAVWGPPKLVLFKWSQWDNLLLQLKGLIPSYSNYFYYTMDIAMASWWKVLIWISVLLLITSLVYNQFKQGGENRLLTVVFTCCVLLSVFLISTISLYSPRYWLGIITGFIFLFIFYVVKGGVLKMNRLIVFLLSGIFIVGAFASVDMRRDWYYANVNEMHSLNALYKEVNREQVKTVFVTDPLLQWKWNYLFGNEIPGTYFSEKERVGRYQTRVLKSYGSNPNKSALIGFYKIYPGFEKFKGFNDRPKMVANKYFIAVDIEDELIDSVFVMCR